MASVIGSARTSTASVFDVITTTAQAADQLLRTASRGIDALDAKTRTMHKRVVLASQLTMETMEEDEITKAALDHTNLMEERYRHVSPDKTFDREAFFQATVTKLEALTA